MLLFDLTVAPFEMLTLGSGGGVLLRRRRSLPTSSVRVMVFSDTAGGGFQGIVHVEQGTRQAEEHEGLKPTMSHPPLHQLR